MPVSETRRECGPLCWAESSSDKSSIRSLWKAEHKKNTRLTIELWCFKSGVCRLAIYQGCRQADITWGSWEGLMILPCLSITRYTGIPEMTLGWMNSSWSTNSAEAPGNCGFSSDESKGCCCRTAWHVEYKHYLLMPSKWLWHWQALYKTHNEGHDIQAKTKTACTCFH